jgi:putative phosphoesterase
MKLAIISDTHGNLVALEATLNDIQLHGIQNIICLGDVANFGPQPKETLERIQELNCSVVMGNADAEMIQPSKLEILEPAQRWFADVTQWCAEQLNDQHKDFIRTFKSTVELELARLKLLVYHGSPKSYNDPITAFTSDETLEGFLEQQTADLFVGGHTHEQFVRRYFDKRVMNPGSVGLPYVIEQGSSEGINVTVAEYAILEVVKGEANVTFRRVRYDVERLEQAVKASGMPHAKNWLGWK